MKKIQKEMESNFKPYELQYRNLAFMYPDACKRGEAPSYEFFAITAFALEAAGDQLPPKDIWDLCCQVLKQKCGKSKRKATTHRRAS